MVLKFLSRQNSRLLSLLKKGAFNFLIKTLLLRLFLTSFFMKKALFNHKKVDRFIYFIRACKSKRFMNITISTSKRNNTTQNKFSN